ncbi:MAG: hypothetical protein LWX83_04520 [Anaerolineae bacterium]|nr:hypothetical protein [Anaerolineae bacterium]
MDINNPVVKLCIEGTQAEFQGKPDLASDLYRQAWSLVSTDFEACVAAHYMARFLSDPQEQFNWNQEALNRAAKVNDGSVDGFYPSLYVNMGKSYEQLGNMPEAQRYYDLAAALGLKHR